jgi:hypothetical protein
MGALTGDLLSGTRARWHELPPRVRGEVERLLGEAVVSAESQPNGFSAGSADRVTTVSGRRAFVKTASDPRSAGLHRREIAVMRQLPATVPVAALLGSFDDGEWVGLVLGDVPGRHPGAGDIDAVLGAIGSLPRADTLALPTIAETLGWAEATVPPGLAYLADLARGATEAMTGDHLVHLDLRCDNVLVDDTGSAVIVDWPWASRGAPWVDGLTFLLDLRRLGADTDCERVLADHPMFSAVAPRDITAVLAALAIEFLTAARLETGTPGLRAFQLSEGAAAAAWVRERVARATIARR